MTVRDQILTLLRTSDLSTTQIAQALNSYSEQYVYIQLTQLRKEGLVRSEAPPKANVWKLEKEKP